MLRIGLLACCITLFNIESPAQAAECHGRALKKLQELAPQGYSVYQNAPDKKFFWNWVKCDDVQLGLTTAVHETVHMLTEEYNAYPLINGKRLPRLPERRPLFPPRLASQHFNAESGFVTTYMKPGSASSAEEFGYLLNELNAYTHDLHAAVQLVSLGSPGRSVYHRDGLAALMAFVSTYTEEARAKHPETWRELQNNTELRRTVATLWDQAEQVMGNSCRTDGYGLEAPEFLEHFCKATIKHALGTLLGRPPLCPISCKIDRTARRQQR